MFNFKQTFTSMRRDVDSMMDDMEKTFDYAEKMVDGGVCLTNNNGHVVITGPVKSLRVNDQTVELKK